MLVPLLVVLFYFSTAHSRRTPTFILIVLAIIFALAETAIMVAIAVRPSVYSSSAIR
jgi:hypothetical protein